ncbi:hypothetical protein EZS27_041100, partial [termite gut metagenome]
RKMMMLEDKYKNANDLKKAVLDVAQKELKEAFDKGQCDLWFAYELFREIATVKSYVVKFAANATR